MIATGQVRVVTRFWGTHHQELFHPGAKFIVGKPGDNKEARPYWQVFTMDGEPSFWTEAHILEASEPLWSE